VLFYYIAALKNRAAFLCAHIRESVDGLSERQLNIANVICSEMESVHKLRRRMEPVMGPKNKQKIMGFAFQFR
jgi:hypothetical protein